jgi:mannose-1-phosphate guanylyltransferase
VALDTYAVIMAGGHSTRFWPLGRRRVPKQFLSIAGRRSLIQETVRRLLPLVSWRRILVVAGAEHAAGVRRQLPRLPPEHVLVEPFSRNTAACIALAAEWISARAGDALMLVVPADHLVPDGSALRRALRAAGSLAVRRECLVLLGVRPTRPETGYGYIELGRQLTGAGRNAYSVRRFREKPPVAAARRYVAGGKHLWNSGMFAWKASTFRAALARCLPGILHGLEGTWEKPSASRRRLLSAYRALPSISVDTGVLQVLSRRHKVEPPIAVLAVTFDWFDVGSWEAMADLWGCDGAGNAARAKLLSIDSEDCIVYAPGHLVALLGVRSLIVAESGGALLVCGRERAQDVREVTRALSRRRWLRYV